MATSRRNFLKVGTMGLLCAGIPAALAKTVVGRSTLIGGFPEEGAEGFRDFTRATFAPYLNTTFKIQTPTGSVNLKLSKITDLKATSKNPARIAGKENLSLLFVDSAKSSFLAQETYVIEHAELGKFSMFLVPIGQLRNGHYEAIINRL